MDVVLQLAVNALVAAGIYALVAAGLSFIYATTRVFHLAHGAVVAWTGFAFWWLWQVHGVPAIPSAVLAIALAALLGLGMNEFVYEPLRARKTKGLGYLIATVALLMFWNAAILIVFGAQPHSLNVETAVIALPGMRITTLQIGILALSAVLLGLLALLVARTKFGRAMRATADNETIAEVMGVKTRTIRRMTFLIGSLLAGVAGICFALEYNVDPNMGIMIAIKGFTASIMGGAGSLSGVVLGSLLLGGVEQAAVWFAGAGWKNAVAFVLLFLCLLVRPRGLFGRKSFS